MTNTLVSTDLKTYPPYFNKVGKFLNNSNKTLLPKKIPLESSSPTVLKTNYTYILI